MAGHDFINGCFEFTAGVLLWLNVWKLHKDKKVFGVHVVPVIFFTVWGYWNLIFYPAVNAWVSFGAGMLVTLANTVWGIQVLYYLRKQRVQNDRR